MKSEDYKKIRKSLGWSQERLAREIGVSFCTVNRWEKGRARPSQMALNALGELATKSSGMPSDARNSTRVNMRCPISVKKTASNAGLGSGLSQVSSVNAVSDDLSSKGLRFSSRSLFKPGEKVELTFILRNGERVQTYSEVVWAQSGKGDKSVGVRYEVDLDMMMKVVKNFFTS